MNLKEIAVAAGVSQSTVTLVLHNRAGVSKKTKERVRELLIENGYSIENEHKEYASESETNQHIVLLKYRTHAMLTDGNHGFISRIIDGLENQCKKYNYDLVFNIIEANELEEAVEEINRKGYKGAILLATEFRKENYDKLKKLQIPMVAVDNAMDDMSVTSLTNNARQSSRIKIEYCISRGHRDIGIVRNMFPTTVCDECFEAYIYHMEHFGLNFYEKNVFDFIPTFDGAYQTMKRYLAEGRELPSILLSHIDVVALGIMKALKEYGIKVPENISIIGADNVINSAFSDPPLTTLEVFVNEMGKWAVDLLHDKIENPNAPVFKLQIDTKLVERESVCDFSDYVRPEHYYEKSQHGDNIGDDD